MLRTRVIPSLLLDNGGLVKTTKFEKPVYLGDPINAVKIFNDKEVDELVILDISATKERREPNFELIESIATEAFMPFAYGGGIRTIEHVMRLFKLGVEKVVINSAAAESDDIIRAAADIAGSQSVVASMDVKKHWMKGFSVYTAGGKKNTKRDPVEYAQAMEAAGAGEILLNAIDHDGTMTGYNLALIRKVSDAVSIPVIAVGGAGQLQHFKQAVDEGGASAVSAGAFFVFHGKHRGVLITYPDYKKLTELFASSQ